MAATIIWGISPDFSHSFDSRSGHNFNLFAPFDIFATFYPEATGTLTKETSNGRQVTVPNHADPSLLDQVCSQ